MSIRNNSWLASKLILLQKKHFSDVKLKNTVLVKFGRGAKTRLGSITMRRRKGHQQPVTIISVNRYLKEEGVPEFVIEAVLAHEFVHYTHGFNSPLPQLYRYPHQSGIVDKELKKRGLDTLLSKEKKWTKESFAKLYHQKSKERKMNDCIFCKIIKKEIPADIVYETEDIIAFHDINKDAPEHVLVIPKKHLETLNDAQETDKELLGKMMLAVKKVALKQGITQTGYRCILNTNKNAGQIVPHLHLHVLGGKPLGRLVQKS